MLSQHCEHISSNILGLEPLDLDPLGREALGLDPLDLEPLDLEPPVLESRQSNKHGPQC